MLALVFYPHRLLVQKGWRLSDSVALVIRSFLPLFPFVVKVLKPLSMRPIGDKHLGLRNIGPQSSAHEELYVAKSAPGEGRRSVAQKSHEWVRRVFQQCLHRFDRSLCLPIRLRVVRAAGYMGEAIGACKLSHLLRGILRPIVTDHYFRYAMPCKPGFEDSDYTSRR